MSRWTDEFSTTKGLREALGDEALVAAMLRYEGELALACGDVGVAPADAAAVIARTAASLHPETGALFDAGARAGTLAIPLVKALTAAVRANDPNAAGYVHLGATSQDVIDTAFVLQAREASRLIEADIARAITAAAGLADRWRDAPMLGRTLMQAASPITFGLKAAQWALGLGEARVGFLAACRGAWALQFGGAAGTLGALGQLGPRVAERLADRLDLTLPPAPWHARRAAVATLAAQAAIIVGACAKIAGDIALMSQPEVAECFEPSQEGSGGSSAMPHKRNPVRCMQIRAAHARAPHLAATLIAAMAQEHERALGGWQAEWSAAPELLMLAGGAAANAAVILEGLVVDAKRMRTNLDALRELPMSEAAVAALAPSLGRDTAFAVVERAAKSLDQSGGTLSDALAASPDVQGVMTRRDLAAIVDAARATGCAQTFIDRALDALRN